MTNVFNFLPRGAESGKTDFLREADETLEFDESARSVASLNLFQSAKAAGPTFVNRDWNNQELADLYRVKRMLDAAGITIEVDRGISDEGDPWFLFLNAQGEVFIHLCRLDGLYILDSPNICEPLRGHDFNALINGFSNRAVAHSAGAGAASDHRVVRLERNGKVFLHPSALLAALVWTLFIAAEELVLIMPEEDGNTLDADDLEALFTSVQGGQNDLGDGRFDLTETLNQNGTALTSAEAIKDADTLTADDIYQRELGTKSILASSQNSYALGLSTIAIALGFVSEGTLSETQSITLSGLFTNNTETGVDAGQDAERGQVERGQVEQVQTVDLAMGVAAEGDDLVSVTPLSEQELTAATAEQPVEVISSVENIVLTRTDVELDVKAKTEAPKVAQVFIQEGANPQLAAAQTPTELPAPMSTAMFAELHGFVAEETFEFTFGQTVVHSTFDLKQTDFVDITGSLLEDPVTALTNSVTAHTVQYGTFDDEARAFVDFVLSKSSNHEIISTNHEIVIIDSAAFDTSGALTYVLSWSLGDDSGVVSMIGLRSEFEAFDLIA